ncbi:hypothetical protein J6G99_08465 [bacterium]|nr:hypothetical protein [bacterium]
MIIDKIVPTRTFQVSLKENLIKKPYLQYTSKDEFVKSKTDITTSQTSRQNISFSGINFAEVEKLTKSISRTTNSKKRVIEKYNSFPEAQGLTLGGGIPQAWLENIKDVKNFDKEAFFEKLGDLFTKDRHESNIDILSKGLEDLFKKHGIAKSTDSVNVEFVGKGFFGRTFKIDINGKDPKIIKEFKRTKRFHNNHGNYSEQNLAEYINAYSGHNTNMARYYFGDTKNGIMVMDYISKETPKPSNIVSLDELGLAYDDEKAANYVGDYIIDYGGLITIKNLVGNKTAQNIYRTFKHMQDKDSKIELFKEITKGTKDEQYRDKMIGLAHSVRFFPEEIQEKLYQQLANSNINHVKFAIIENIRNFPKTFDCEGMLENIVKNADSKIKEACAREIKYFPEKLRHRLFEELSMEDNNKIKKYLARNINYYYKNITNRPNIFNNISQNTDMYADLAIIDALKWMGDSSKAAHFERLFNKDNMIIKSALVRSIDIFGEDSRTIEKWINKFLEINDPRVQRSLCEIVSDLPSDIRTNVFRQLLDVTDLNAKEFLAESFINLPGFENKIDWLKKILKGADNSVRRSLALSIDKIKSPQKRQEWIELICENSDSSVPKIIKEHQIK